jgi:tetratricopeptide (TPR) repeat protein
MNSVHLESSLASIAAQRQMEPARLAKLMRGELDWIVMKTLEKDRNRRYETASGFAADVQRYLDDQQVEACPPSARYRLRKFTRRNRTLLMTSCLVALALIAGTAVSTWQAFEATSARKLADERLENEKQARADAVEQRQQATVNLQQALNAVDQMLMQLGDERLAGIPGSDPVRRELFRDALAYYERFFRHAADDPQLRINTAKAWLRVAGLHDFFGDLEKGQEARRESIQIWETLHQENPDDSQVQNKLARVYLEFGNCEHWVRYRWASAGPALETALSLWEDLQRRFPDNLDYQWDAALAEFNLGDNYRCENRAEQAERALRHAVDVQRQLWSRDSVSSERRASICGTLGFLAIVRESISKDDGEVERLHVEAVSRGEEVVASDPQSPVAAAALIGAARLFGDFLNGLRRLPEAEARFRRAVEVGQLTNRNDASRVVHRNDASRKIGWISWLPPLAAAQIALGNLLAGDGRHSEAIRHFRDAGDLTRPVAVEPNSGAFARMCVEADNGLVGSLGELARGGHRDEARKFCEELSQTLGSASTAPSSFVVMAMAWQAIGELSEMDERCKYSILKAARRIESREAINQTGHGSQYFKIFSNMALHLATCADPTLRDPVGALLCARKATDLAPNDGNCWSNRGPAHYRVGDWTGTVSVLEKSVEMNNGGDISDWFFLAMAHWQLDQKAEALKWYDQAIEWMDKNQPDDEKLHRFRLEAAELLGLNDEQD